MDIHFYATLRQVTNAKTVSFDLPETNTAQQILDAVVARFPGMVGMLVDEDGKMLGHCHMFINGRGVTFLVDEMDTVVHSSTDVVKFFPAVGGGTDLFMDVADDDRPVA